MVCGGSDARLGGWTYAQTFTFMGRVHRVCLDAYDQMKPLMFDLYRNEDGTIKDQGGFEISGGWAAVLDGLGVPRVGDDWDKSHPGYHAWWHGVQNCGKLIRMMEATR